MGLPGQLSLQIQGERLVPEDSLTGALPFRPAYFTEGQIMSP